MKFLLDAQLPFLLAQLSASRGFDVKHTNNLPLKNLTPDSDINAISIREERILFTKDTDFFNSYVLHKMPFKLVLIRTGNVRLNKFMNLMRLNLDDIIKNIEHCQILEVDIKGDIKVIF